MNVIMNINRKISIVLLVFICCINEMSANSQALDEIDKTTAEIVRLRGFDAEDHFVTTSDGYILNLVKATNPLLESGTSGLQNKDPILFIHGIMSTSGFFIMNSVGAKPKNYGNKDAGSMNSASLSELLAEDPASKSLAFTAQNFGHEVWLLNRRGSSESLGHVRKNLHANLNPSSIQAPDQPSIYSITNWLLANLIAPLSVVERTVNQGYWNYSLDEQAILDIPEVIDYILKESDRTKLSVVGHSAGGALILMSLVNHPNLADKINKAILWAPALDLGGTATSNIVLATGSTFAPLLEGYLGPLPSIFFSNLIKLIETNLCSSNMLQNTVCEPMDDLLFGPAGGQQTLLAGFRQFSFDTTSFNEFLQLAQSVNKGRMHFFDYQNADKNFIAYGQHEAPKYNVSLIKATGMSIWTGGTDTQVSISDTEILLGDGLTVPLDLHFLNQTGLFFNHLSFAQHKEIAKLLTIPCLKILEST